MSAQGEERPDIVERGRQIATDMAHVYGGELERVLHGLCDEVTRLRDLHRGVERADHEPWCDANHLKLCEGCAVKKGWHYNSVTGEPTTCRQGNPHVWNPKPCNCGPNDRRKVDRRASEEASPVGETIKIDHFCNLPSCTRCRPSTTETEDEG